MAKPNILSHYEANSAFPSKIPFDSLNLVYHSCLQEAIGYLCQIPELKSENVSGLYQGKTLFRLDDKYVLML